MIECGVDLPFRKPRDTLTSSTWTVKIEKATVYAAFAKAYLPPIFNPTNETFNISISHKVASGNDEHGSEYRPQCGVSLAVVGKGSALDQQGQAAGTAFITDELFWCESFPGLAINITAPNCLPYFNAYNPTPSPVRAPMPQPTVPAPAAPAVRMRAQVARTIINSVPVAVASEGGASAWSQRMTAVLDQQDDLQDICNHPAVGFANPGSLKVTLEPELTSGSRRTYTRMH